MAWLENDRSGNVHVCFRFGGQKFRRSLHSKSRREAEARKQRLEENIRLVECGRLDVPTDTDVATFLLSDGKLGKRIRIPTPLTLQQLFIAFFDNLPKGNLEASTVRGMEIHRRHLERHLGKSFSIQNMVLEELQAYVAKRSREAGLRGRQVSASTINKEIVTLRSVWNWGVDMNRLKGTFPNKGLRLPKEIEMPPFQTWNEIQRQIDRGGLSDAEEADLWGCLFLNLEEIAELLDHVKRTANQPFIYPMFVMAAHTGARRSELLRSQVSDFNGSDVIIRERKRVRGMKSTRRVPLSSTFREAIHDWLANHPGGRYTFCQVNVLRSKKRCDGPRSITRDEANDHLKRTLQNSKWEKVRGWHCFRHSFCSNCAMRGVDQRVIDSWVGHSTESMRRRYRHLFPNSAREAMELVFG